jgi:hypothetical protein
MDVDGEGYVYGMVIYVGATVTEGVLVWDMGLPVREIESELLPTYMAVARAATARATVTPTAVRIRVRLRTAV